MIKEITKSFIFKVAIILTFLYCLYDIFSRIIPTYNHEQKLQQVETITALPSIVLNSEDINSLNSLLIDFDKKPSIEKPKEGMLKKDQNTQQGELTSLFIDDYKLELKAVVFTEVDKNQKALILVKDLINGNEDVVAFRHLEQVYGYLLTINKNTQVTLTRINENNVEQNIVLTMYTAKDSTSYSTKSNLND